MPAVVGRRPGTIAPVSIEETPGGRSPDRVAAARGRRRAAPGAGRGDDALVYAGYGAGRCVLAPSLRGLDAVDAPERVTDAYGGEPIFEGLDVLHYAIVPHVDSPDHPATRELSEVAATYRADGVPHRAMRDGEVLMIEGDQTRLCG
jgi:dipeptidase E